MTVSFKVQDSVVFVTGTNKPNGIGRAIVEALIAGGAAKIYATARNATQLNELVEKHHEKVVAVSLDVTDLASISSLSNLYTDVTLLVNNAGYASLTSTLDDLDEAIKMVQINFVAPLALGKAFSKVFSAAKSSDANTSASAIVNINSIGSFVNFPLAGPYSASKAGAHSMTQAQRRDFAGFCTLVIGVYPGPIDTDMSESSPLEKTSPKVVAAEILEALSSGAEEVFPDPMAKQLYEQWKSDAKALENYMTSTVQP
jgi:NAD(P)-dependent dehydrogenase (short-subunit alcohol dehydrogenase family)